MLLQKMRARAQGLFAKVLVGVIVFVLAVFGFGAIDLFSISEPVAATVNGTDITQRTLELETARQRVLEADRFGDDISDELLERYVSREAVLSVLIDRALLGQIAGDLDMSVAAETLQARIAEIFEGYDEAAYLGELRARGYTPATFQTARAEAELEDQLRGGFSETAFVTNRELRRIARIAAQQRDIAWLMFPVESLLADVDLSDADVEEYYDANLDDYMTDERFDFDFVRISRASLETGFEADEEAVESAYQAEIAAAEPRRHAAHILLKVGADRGVEEAKRLLTEIRAEIEAGASFEERARALSEDPGSASAGGDLGAASKGVFPEAFGEALWALEPGQLSEPVETESGVHLIKLVKISEVEIPALEELRDEIVAQLRDEDVQRRFEQTLRDMDEIAFEQGDSLTALTTEYSLTVEHLGGVTRDSREGILQDPVVRRAMFSDEVLMEGFNSRAVATADFDAVVTRLRTRYPAELRPLEEVREDIRDRLAYRGARDLAEEAALKALADLASGTTPTDVAASTDTTWERADAVERTDDYLPEAIVDTAFEMPAPPPGEREIGISTLADGSRAVVVLSKVELGDYGTFGDTDRQDLTRSLKQLNARREFVALLASLRAKATIDAVDLPNPP